MPTLRIWIGQPTYMHLDFTVLSTPVAGLWLERMANRHHWPMDDAQRFYGFNDVATEAQHAADMILQCVDTINAYDQIIERPFTSVHDQDYLNYLHHVFETWHGLLDQQTHEWWLAAPEPVRAALARLNIAVHRCESLRSNRARLVCTWFGMPKDSTLDPALQREYGSVGADFGGVYLNYAEIGKTVLDLARDQDQYIADEAFRPFDHYSADFVVTFFQDSQQQKQAELDLVADYYYDHRDFFQAKGILSHLDVRIAPLRFKVAQLTNMDHTEVIESVRKHQYVVRVEII